MSQFHLSIREAVLVVSMKQESFMANRHRKIGGMEDFQKNDVSMFWLSSESVGRLICLFLFFF